MTFEERLARLEEIIEALEGDEVELARALALFEEGVACLRGAGDELARVEERVRTLSERSDGGFALDEADG